MRCSVRIPLPVNGVVTTAETYCYEPLDDNGVCRIHGLQVVPVKPKENRCPHCNGLLEKT